MRGSARRRFPWRVSPDLHQPERAARRLRPRAGPRGRRRARLAPAPLHARRGQCARARAGARSPDPCDAPRLYDRTEGWCAGLILLHDQLRNGRALARAERIHAGGAVRLLRRRDLPAGRRRLQDVLMRTAFLPKMTEAIARRSPGSRGSVRCWRRCTGRTTSPTSRPATRRVRVPSAFPRIPPGARHAELLARDAHHDPTDGRRVPRRGGPDRGRGHPAPRRRGLGGAGPADPSSRRHAAGPGPRRDQEEWLGHLPAAIFEEQPWLRFWRGMGWLAWRHAECERALEDAFGRFAGRAIRSACTWRGRA